MSRKVVVDMVFLPEVQKALKKVQRCENAHFEILPMWRAKILNMSGLAFGTSKSCARSFFFS
jgi:hypothetical protein